MKNLQLILKLHGNKKNNRKILSQRRIKKLQVLKRTQNASLKLKNLKILQFDPQTNKQIDALRKMYYPFKLIVQDENILIQQLVKQSNSQFQVKDLIPIEQQQNLDILASSNEYFEGSNASKHMLTMSIQAFTEYDGPLNLYLAQIPLFKSLKSQDIELLRHRKIREADLLKNLNILQLKFSKIRKPDFVTEELDSVNLWATKGYSDSGWHYDSYENYLVILKGVKVVWLSDMSKNEWQNWQPVSDENYNHLKEGKQNWNPKHSKFVILHSGQILYIPRGWLHRVKSVEESVAVNIWFGGPYQNNGSLGFNLRQNLNLTMTSEAEISLKNLVIEQLRKIPHRKLNQYVRIIKTMDYDQLNLRFRFRTKLGFSSDQELKVLILILQFFPSTKMVEFLIFVTKKFGKKCEIILSRLEPLCFVILSLKLTDFTQKDQFAPCQNPDKLLESFTKQKAAKTELREILFSLLWENFSQQFLDSLQDQSKIFHKTVLKQVLTQHLL